MQRRMAQLTQHMAQAKPYLESDLTLTALAKSLDLNPYHLSQVLNEGFGENFYKFINRYRVEESKRLLLNPAFSHYTLLAIASEAGFSSKTTFNKTFKEHTGLTPSEFIKSTPH
jgi:YesN/AraC family two-component response regulator